MLLSFCSSLLLAAMLDPEALDPLGHLVLCQMLLGLGGLIGIVASQHAAERSLVLRHLAVGTTGFLVVCWTSLGVFQLAMLLGLSMTTASAETQISYQKTARLAGHWMRQRPRLSIFKPNQSIRQPSGELGLANLNDVMDVVLQMPQQVAACGAQMPMLLFFVLVLNIIELGLLRALHRRVFQSIY